MTITRSTSAALDQRLASMSGLPDVAWPNVPFTPTDGVLHLRVSNLPAAGSLYSMDYGQETGGVYQVSVYAPIGGGPADAENMADNIRAHFAADRKLGNVNIESIDVAPAVIDQPWYNVPVSINYRVWH